MLTLQPRESEIMVDLSYEAGSCDARPVSEELAFTSFSPQYSPVGCMLERVSSQVVILRLRVGGRAAWVWMQACAGSCDELSLGPHRAFTQSEFPGCDRETLHH